MKTRILSCVLLLALCLPLALGLTSCGQDTKFTFEKLTDQEAYKLIKAESSAEEIVIPSTYEGLPVVDIEETAFTYCTKLKKLTVPASITAMDDVAINSIMDLEELHVEDLVAWLNVEYRRSGSSGGGAARFKLYEGDTLVEKIDGTEARFENVTATTLKRDALGGCISLKEITLWGSVKKIDSSAFAGCEALEKFVSNGLVTEYACCFTNCPALKTVDLNGITSTGNGGIFNDCPALESVTFPHTLRTFHDNAFLKCDALKKVTFECFDDWSETMEQNVERFKSNNPTVEVIKVVG